MQAHALPAPGGVELVAGAVIDAVQLLLGEELDFLGGLVFVVGAPAHEESWDTGTDEAELVRADEGVQLRSRICRDPETELLRDGFGALLKPAVLGAEGAEVF